MWCNEYGLFDIGSQMWLIWDILVVCQSFDCVKITSLCLFFLCYRTTSYLCTPEEAGENDAPFRQPKTGKKQSPWVGEWGWWLCSNCRTCCVFHGRLYFWRVLWCYCLQEYSPLKHTSSVSMTAAVLEKAIHQNVYSSKDAGYLWFQKTPWVPQSDFQNCPCSAQIPRQQMV